MVTLTLTVTDIDGVTASAECHDHGPWYRPDGQHPDRGPGRSWWPRPEDSDGTEYAWTADPAVGTFSGGGRRCDLDGAGCNAQVVTLTLTVTDSDGATASDSVTITVWYRPDGQHRDRGPGRSWRTVLSLQATSAEDGGLFVRGPPIPRWGRSVTRR